MNDPKGDDVIPRIILDLITLLFVERLRLMLILLTSKVLNLVFLTSSIDFWVNLCSVV